jgi:two-component flavin-dependent monooxygenase
VRRETAAAQYADSVFADFEDRPEQAAEPRFMAHSAPAEVVAGVH